ncbi:MAG TPA: hypothetical protein PKA32_03365 [Candidatus Gracilibacteria bacterium]|nr:hypothetical protein [Candidatus Gracilibacteria bacterium]
MQSPNPKNAGQESEKQPQIIEQQEQKEALELPIQPEDLQANNKETQEMAAKNIESNLQKLQSMEKINPSHDS